MALATTRGHSRPLAAYFLFAQKVGKDQRLTPLESLFPDPISFVLPKETVSDRQRKALTDPSVHLPIDRRAKSGYFLLLFPLPLMHVVAKSAQLHFRLTAKIAFAPLLLLSPPNPLRWASAGASLELPAATVERLVQAPVGSRRVPRARHVTTTARRAAAGTRGECVGLPHAGKRIQRHPILGARKNGGPGAMELRTKARPWRL